MENYRKLYRTQDALIAGVCGGLAEFFGLDASLVRIATVVLILSSDSRSGSTSSFG